MHKVFISHASEERLFVLKLTHALREYGHQVWLDEFDLRSGDMVPECIDGGLAWCNIFILSVSPPALQSKWVQYEAREIAQKADSGSVRMIPLRMVDSGVTWPAQNFPPGPWEDLLYCDVTSDPCQWSQQINQILQGVDERISSLHRPGIEYEEWVNVWNQRNLPEQVAESVWHAYRDRRCHHLHGLSDLNAILNLMAKDRGTAGQIAERAQRFILAYPVHMLPNYHKWLDFARIHSGLSMVRQSGVHGFAYTMTSVDPERVAAYYRHCDKGYTDHDMAFTKALAMSLGAVPCQGMPVDT